jgi:transcriptional regulator with XRE-family HTH domain
MNQPDLGKKIAELRKAKGLTQEELVEKCNLNVRTLQRIESGEVTPRSYTIKTIFTALDYNVYDSSEIPPNKFRNTGFIISNWLEQLYKYVLDLFNLKTNTMKKITILSLIATAIVFGIASFTNSLKAQKESKIEKTQGEKIVVSGSFNGSDNQEEFNGRNVNCTIDGVFFKSPLLILDKKTHEFHTNSAKGILFKNKIEIKTMIAEFENSADNIEKNGNKLILKGKAKLVFSDSEVIEADEIIILKE